MGSRPRDPNPPCWENTSHSDSNIASSPCAIDHNFSPTKLYKWRVRSGLDTMYTSSRNANSSSPSNISCFASFRSLWMARLKRRGTRGSSCSPRVSGRLGADSPDKRQEGTEPWHLQQFRHHCAPEHMVVRSNSVDGEECRIWVPLRHDSNCVLAVDSGPSGQRQLKGFLVIQTHLLHFVRASSRSW